MSAGPERKVSPPDDDQKKPEMPGSPPPARRVLPVVLPVVLFLALAGLFGIALKKGDPSKLPSALLGKQAPVLQMPPVAGITAADGQPMPSFGPAEIASGRPVVVNFWASWCLPCVEEHPFLVALTKRTGVKLLGVNHKDEPSNARQFLARHGNPYSAIGADRNGRVAIEWGVYGMPETFIVDGKGTIVHKHVGPIGAEALETKIIPALKKAGLGE